MGTFSNFLENFNLTQLIWLLISIAATLFCLTVHEVCHGLAAYWLGDDTAKEQGRLSLNPIWHIDPLGFLLLITVHVGWAKPVPVDMRAFRHPKGDMALTALAGPASNLLTAVIALWAAELLCRSVNTVTVYFVMFLLYVTVLSVGLGLFNLIPIPPLDGSRILFALLPDRIYMLAMRYERFIMVAVMILLWAGLFSGPLNWAIQGVLQGLCRVTGFPYGLLVQLMY